MKRATILKHAIFEGPGKLAPLLEALGYALDVRELYRGDPVPTDPAAFDVLVVMGGPMGVQDAAEVPFLRSELLLLERCVARHCAVVGICLGAQLLAAAAGARVRQMEGPGGGRLYEVGWGDVSFERQGSADPLLGGIPDRAPMLHWHGDTFDLPSGARRFASTARCENQAFLLGTRQVGLQFHCEVGAGDIATFLREDRAFAEKANGPDAVGSIERDTERYHADFERVGEQLLRNILAVICNAATWRNRR